MRNYFFRDVRVILILLLVRCCSFAQESKSGQVICESQLGSPLVAGKIKEPSERSAFLTALNKGTPAEKGAALDAFTHEYPTSVARIDALKEALTAFQQAAKPLEADQTATRILRDNPNDVCALAVILSVRRSSTVTDYNDWMVEATRGLRLLRSWLKPENMSNAEYENQHSAMAVIFYGAAGYGALIAKDFALARDYYQKSLSINPNNQLDNSELGIADLEMIPLDPQGFWYIAKAITLAQHTQNTNAVSGMTAYAKTKYRKYHGEEDGWDQIVARAATEPGPPIGFTVTAH